MDSLPKILTAEQIAQYLAISKKTVYELIKSGDIKGFCIGRTVRVEKSDFIQWIQDQKSKKAG